MSAKGPKSPCRFPGCPELGGYITEYCAKHTHIAHRCMIDDCQNRVAAKSRSKCCRVHRNEGARLLRKAFRPWES